MMIQRMKLKLSILWMISVSLRLHSVCEGRRLPLPLAISLPGFGGGNDGGDRRQEKQPPPPPPGGTRRQEQPPRQDDGPIRTQPPPPPRPPDNSPISEGATSEERNRNISEELIEYGTQQQQQQQHPPPFWGSNPFFPPPPPTGWLPRHQQQPPPNEWADERLAHPYEGQLNDFEVLRRELDDCLAREGDLLGQIENLTGSVSAFVQREDLHMRQLDVLTERVIDAEALVASERNALLEYQANCTELEKLIASMQQEMADWEAKCGNLTEQHQLDLDALEDMKRVVAQRERETEDLATVIETARLEDEQDRLFVEQRKRKRRGFFTWLFGLNNDEDDDEDRLREARELAKNTLLRALQTERNSVHELEAALTTLQLNNSAISEMVQSRDTLIQELNDRVAVFEEDKLVLKAALRQLQKEMKEEAPKTQQLINDLRDSREEISKLNAEMKEVAADHRDEIEDMEALLLQKQSAINQTESNLTVIGTYVDKLEERLASFAIARRDIQIREEKCEAIEERAIEMERERDELSKQVESFEGEHDELKTLLGELVSERTKLQQEKVSMEAERDGLLEEGRQLRSTIETLEVDVDGLAGTMNEWKEKVFELEHRLRAQQLQLESFATQEAERNSVDEEREELTTKIVAIDRERVLLQDERNGLECARAALEEERLRVDALKLELHFEKQRLASLQPPPPPPRSSSSSDTRNVESSTQPDFDPKPVAERKSDEVVSNVTEASEERESDSDTEIDTDYCVEKEIEVDLAISAATPSAAVNVTELPDTERRGENKTEPNVEASMEPVSPQAGVVVSPPPLPDILSAANAASGRSTDHTKPDEPEPELPSMPPPELPPTISSYRIRERRKPVNLEAIDSAPPPLPENPLGVKNVADDTSTPNSTDPELPPLPPPDLPSRISPYQRGERTPVKQEAISSPPPLPEKPLAVKSVPNATSTGVPTPNSTDPELPPLPPPELPRTRASSHQKNETNPLQPRKPPPRPRPRRKVLLRGVRKALSKTTGLHGLLTPSTRQLAAKRRHLGKDPNKRTPKIPAKKEPTKPSTKINQVAKSNPRSARPKPSKKRENARFNFFSGKR